MQYDFGKQYQEWARFPVDDFGYLTAKELLALHAVQMLELANYAFNVRFDPGGWRNKDNLLDGFMVVDRGAVVMDYGCGFSMDSLRFALAGATVIPADMHPLNLVLAQRVLGSFAHTYPPEVAITLPYPPWFTLHQKIDLFWSMGVLHHTSDIGPILQTACSYLKPTGECRIVLYSDKRWQQMTGEAMPEGRIDQHPKFAEFVRKCDTVGFYADCYDQAKLERVLAPFQLAVTRVTYLCNDQMIGAVVKPRGTK